MNMFEKVIDIYDNECWIKITDIKEFMIDESVNESDTGVSAQVGWELRITTTDGTTYHYQKEVLAEAKKNDKFVYDEKDLRDKEYDIDLTCIYVKVLKKMKKLQKRINAFYN